MKKNIILKYGNENQNHRAFFYEGLNDCKDLQEFVDNHRGYVFRQDWESPEENLWDLLDRGHNFLYAVDSIKTIWCYTWDNMKIDYRIEYINETPNCKFQIGDKIKGIRQGIIKAQYGGCYSVRWNNYDHDLCYTISEIDPYYDLVEEKKMNKFKVGDKIEWKTAGGFSNIEIVKITDNNYYLLYEDKSRGSFDVKYVDDNYQLVEKKMKFKVGDKIKFTNGTNGTVAIIEAIEFSYGTQTKCYRYLIPALLTRDITAVSIVDKCAELFVEKQTKNIKIAAIDLSDYEIIEDTISIDVDQNIKDAVEDYLNKADVKGDFIVHVWEEKKYSIYNIDPNASVNLFSTFPDMTFKVKVGACNKTIHFVEN